MEWIVLLISAGFVLASALMWAHGDRLGIVSGVFFGMCGLMAARAIYLEFHARREPNLNLPQSFVERVPYGTVLGGMIACGVCQLNVGLPSVVSGVALGIGILLCAVFAIALYRTLTDDLRVLGLDSDGVTLRRRADVATIPWTTVLLTTSYQLYGQTVMEVLLDGPPDTFGSAAARRRLGLEAFETSTDKTLVTMMASSFGARGSGLSLLFQKHGRPNPDAYAAELRARGISAEKT